MTCEQMETHQTIIERVAKKFARRYRNFIDPDDAAQTVAAVALETRVDETRSELEIKKYLYARLYGGAQDAIRRERPGLRCGKAPRTVCFSDREQFAIETYGDEFEARYRATDVEIESYRVGLVEERRSRVEEFVRWVAEYVAERLATAQQKQAYRLYFQKGLTMKEVGAVLGLSESRVSQLVSQFVAAARPAFEEAGFSVGERRPGRRIR